MVVLKIWTQVEGGGEPFNHDHDYNKEVAGDDHDHDEDCDDHDYNKEVDEDDHDHDDTCDDLDHNHADHNEN